MKHCRDILEIAASVACLALAAAPAQAQAQPFPSKPVSVIVQFPPGGTPDIYGRIMAAELAKAWSQSVVVENRTGASGTIGTELVAKSPPDGYTLLFASDAPITVVPNLMTKIGYDPVRDLTPIANFPSGPLVVGVTVRRVEREELGSRPDWSVPHADSARKTGG